MGKMYKQAEWYLYHYQDVKAKEAKTRAEIEEDAYNSAFGSGDNTPVKSSLTSSKTERAATELITKRNTVLTPIEQMWIWAIEDVWAVYNHEDKAMCRFMERAFGLTGKRVHKGNKGVVRDQIMGDYFMERVQTYYEYRRKIIMEVVESALEFKAYNRSIKNKPPK